MHDLCNSFIISAIFVIIILGTRRCTELHCSNIEACLSTTVVVLALEQALDPNPRQLDLFK